MSFFEETNEARKKNDEMKNVKRMKELVKMLTQGRILKLYTISKEIITFYIIIFVSVTILDFH